MVAKTSIGTADTPGQHSMFFIELTCSWHHRLLYCRVEQKHPGAAKAPPPTPTATCCLFIPYVYFGKGDRGRGGQREDRGATVH
jgi:hypothetical protein